MADTAIAIAASQRLGTVAWERAGGPPLTLSERLSALAGAGWVVSSTLASKLRWRLSPRPRPKIDLSAWEPPDTRAAREATEHLRDVSTPQMVHHSLRTYWFSAVMCELLNATPLIDRETLYVAAAMHDVGLFEDPRPPTEHCFTVGCAREARRIATAANWDEARQDRMAMAITSNLNAFVPAEVYGPEAWVISAGGKVEILAQEYQLHPDNLGEILHRHPRDGFAADAALHVRAEARRNPGCRFACLGPLFPMVMQASRFSLER